MNISLLGRDLLQGTVDPGGAILVVSFTVLSAFAAISLAARLFGGEAVLYGSSVGWGEFLQRPKRERTVATMSAALLTLAMLFPLQFVSVNLLAQIGALSLGARLLAMGVCSLCLFMGTAGLSNWWGNVRFAEGFRWRTPRLLTFPAAMLLGVSLWPFALEMTLWLRSWGMVSFKSENFEKIQELLAQAQAVPLPVVLISFAVIPALSEEFFFRGFLQSALMDRFKPAKAILLSALLFGSFHLITTDGLAIERFPSSTVLGIVLGWICRRTGSIFPGMMLHLMHNGLLTSLAYHSEELKRMGWGVSEEEHVPLMWLATAGTIAAGGFWLMLAGTRKQGESLSEPQRDGADR
jgi:ABC-2 type transport system permease protein/sodium transport system permease protein